VAIGDCFAVFMGTATTNRQPAAGVFEEVSSLMKSGTVDDVLTYDGTDGVTQITGAVATDRDIIDSTQTSHPTFNMALKIGNTVYLRKAGTTDRIAISGVQVDA